MYNINWTEFIPISQVIGWTIINSLWQITIIAICWRIFIVFIPQNRSNLRYSFTLLALIASMFWIGLSFNNEWSSNRLLSIDNQHLEQHIAPSYNFSKTAEESPLGATNHFPKTNTKGNHPTIINKSWISALVSQDWYQEAIALGQKWNPYIPYLAMIWFLGVWSLSFMIIGSFFQLNRLKTVGVSTPESEWLQRFELLKKQMGITRKVQFLCAERIVAPLTFYFFKPVVLAPIGLFTGFPPAQIEVLLLHELAHIRRHDFLVNIFQSLIEILFFYHPAVWWMSSELRKEREHCCDDLVISIRNNPQLYAEALTCLQSPNFSLKTSLAMAATGKNGSFSQRIFRLFGQYKHQPVSLKGTILFLVLLFTGFLTQGFYSTKDKPTSTTILRSDVPEITTLSTESILPSPTTPVIYEENTSSIPLTPLEQFDTKTLNGLPLTPVASIEQKDHHLELLDFAEAAVVEHKEQLRNHFNTVSTKQESNTAKTISENVETNIKDGEKIYIDWSIPENANHYNASKFKKWSAKKIKKLYLDNAKAKKLQDKNKLQTEGSFSSMKEFDPLIYTITDGVTSRKVTLATYVNHHRKILKPGLVSFWAKQKSKRALKTLRENNLAESLSHLQGQLPSIVNSISIHSSDRTKHLETGIGITLKEHADNVTIEVLTQEGELVNSLTNSPLNAGSHEFTWRHAEEVSGTYQLDIIVNGEKSSQLRTIKTKHKKKKVTKNQGDTNACRELLRAVKSQNIDQVSTLLKTVKPNCTYYDDGEARSPLVAAARLGNRAIGKLLLDKGAKTSFHAQGDESPLMAAANYGHLEFAKMLIDKGAKVNQKIAGDGTALICALKNGQYEISKLLLENGADPKLGSAGDENPIYHASKQKDPKYLDLVLTYMGKK